MTSEVLGTSVGEGKLDARKCPRVGDEEEKNIYITVKNTSNGDI